MGLWLRRSLGMSREIAIEKNEDNAEQEWNYLFDEDREKRLEKARQFRQSGRVEP